MDLRTSPRECAVPIVIVQGAEDVDTPIELAQAYLDSIAAPSKSLVPLKRGGHTALVDDAEAFARALSEYVLPLARAAPVAAPDTKSTTNETVEEGLRCVSSRLWQVWRS